MPDDSLFNADAFGGSGDLTPGISQSPLRDWTVLEAIRDALEATGAFDEVALGQASDEQGIAASSGKLAVVMPASWDEVDDADGVDDPAAINDARNTVRMRFTLELSVREGDPAARGSELDRLVNVAKNAIDGAELIPGSTVPGWTKLRGGRWEKPRPPEWTQTIVGETAYFVDGDDLHSEDEV